MQTTEERPADAPFRFERRRASRGPAVGVVSVQTRPEAGDEPTLGRMHVLDLIDASAHGLGARSGEPIPAGTPVTITFGDPRALPRRGTVGRCLPTEDGFRIGIMFERRLAA